VICSAPTNIYASVVLENISDSLSKSRYVIKILHFTNVLIACLPIMLALRLRSTQRTCWD